MPAFSKKYSATVLIHASPGEVWEALTDLDKYGSWNPFTIRVETDWQIGRRVILTVQMRANRKPIRQIERLSRFVPGHEIVWGMDWGIWLQAERIQRITKTSPGLVRYETEDRIHGLLSPLVHFLYGRYIQGGFEAMAYSLKKYIEET